MPLGNWAREKKWKEVGLLNRVSSEEGIEGYLLYSCVEVLGWQYEEVQVMLAKARAALRNKALHAYYPG